MNKENRRTQKDLVTERKMQTDTLGNEQREQTDTKRLSRQNVKMQTDTLGNEQREQTDTNRLRDRSKDADRYARQ